MDTRSKIKVNVEGASLTLAERIELEKTLQKKVNEMRNRKYDTAGNPKVVNFKEVKDKAVNTVKKIDPMKAVAVVTAAGLAAKTWIGIHQECRLAHREHRLQKEAKRRAQ